MPMHVLMTAPSVEKPGGVTSYCRTMRKYLTENVTYLTVGARRDNEPLARRILRAAADYARFAVSIATRRVDVVHLNPSFGSMALLRESLFLLISRLFGKRVVVYIHGWDHGCERRIRERFLRPFRTVYSSANAFVVLADEFRQALHDMGIRKPVFVEATFAEPCEYCAAGLLNVRAGQECRLLMLSRIEKAKGVYETVDAYRALKKHYPELTLAIAGHGPDLPRLRQYVESHRIAGISFYGYVSGKAKHDAFAAADVYVMPTYTEGMPVALLEAMAHGLPVVTRPVGGIADFFEQGKMGFLAERTDAACVAGAIEPLIKDASLRTGIGDYNRTRAGQWFMPWVAAARLQAVYRNVVLRREGFAGSSWLDEAGIRS